MSSARDRQPDRRLIAAKHGRASCPLTSPYELSFTTLTAFESVWVSLEDDAGEIGIGEAVALPGYGDETVERVQQTVASLLSDAVGVTAAELRATCHDALGASPFAASAILTALDLPDYLECLRPDWAFDLNAPIAGDAEPAVLGAALERALARGCSYVKVKVGRTPDAERRNASWLLTARPDARYTLVFDANQGYSVDEARRLSDTLATDPFGRLLWFEQPVDRRDWDEMSRVCSDASVPIVLDECIYTAHDMEQARSIGAPGVKLQGFKNGGIAATLALAAHAGRALLTVVFGNGVATDIGNFAELLTLGEGARLFTPPSESSGFAKLAAPLCDLGLVIDDGYRLTCGIDAATARQRLRSFHAS